MNKGTDIGDILRIYGLQYPTYLIPGWRASRSPNRPVRRSFSEDARTWSIAAHHFEGH